MFPELCSWTWNQVPLTQSELGLSDSCSDLITSFSDNQEQATTGPRAIILKVLN